MCVWLRVCVRLMYTIHRQHAHTHNCHALYKDSPMFFTPNHIQAFQYDVPTPPTTVCVRACVCVCVKMCVIVCSCLCVRLNVWASVNDGQVGDRARVDNVNIAFNLSSRMQSRLACTRCNECCPLCIQQSCSFSRSHIGTASYISVRCFAQRVTSGHWEVACIPSILIMNLCA